jgi:hypothetical protein
MTTFDNARYWRSAGVVMAGLGGTLMLVNAARTFLEPAVFATYLGLPLASPADAEKLVAGETAVLAV